MSSPESETPKAVETPVAQETPGENAASAELSPEQLEGVSGGVDTVKHITEIVTQISTRRAEMEAAMVKNIRG